eukprot:10590577-Alexandrium_andersonii.AAC.1
MLGFAGAAVLCWLARVAGRSGALAARRRRRSSAAGCMRGWAAAFAGSAAGWCCAGIRCWVEPWADRRRTGGEQPAVDPDR